MVTVKRLNFYPLLLYASESVLLTYMIWIIVLTEQFRKMVSPMVILLKMYGRLGVVETKKTHGIKKINFGFNVHN